VSIRDQIAPLEELASIDADIRRIDAELAKHRGGLEALRADQTGLETRLKVDREMVANMEKTRNELVGELRPMASQIERSREKLQRSRNERESNAAQRELEELRKLSRDREDEIQRVTGALDQARSSIDDTEGKLGKLTAELDGSSEGTTQAIATLEGERAVKAAAREEAVRKLPVVLYRRYQSVLTRRPMAIAKTTDGTCLGCHIAVPPMMFQKMRRQEEFEQCPNCRRILYYVPPEPTGDGAADPSRA
jgi:hypothetical protein